MDPCAPSSQWFVKDPRTKAMRTTDHEHPNKQLVLTRSGTLWAPILTLPATPAVPLISYNDRAIVSSTDNT
jgi:hypothetical protein